MESEGKQNGKSKDGSIGSYSTDGTGGSKPHKRVRRGSWVEFTRNQFHTAENWVSEEDYDNSHPAIDYEWWTYDGYKEWLKQEKKTLQEMADDRTMVETSEGSFEWTQEMTDQSVAEYEQTLKDIKNGLLVSKSVDGDTECMTTFNSDWFRRTGD